MKILISDFDGTFLDKNFEENIKFVRDFVKKGNLFVLATGRNVISLKKAIASYDIPFSYLIHNDGGIIVNSDYQEIRRLDLKKELSMELYSILEDSNLFSNIFLDTGYVYLKDVTKQSNRVIGKIIDRKQSEKFLEKLRKNYEQKIYAYLSNNWINITSKENNKLTAIKWLVKENNWESKDIYTVGNDENDLEMLKVSQGYAVGNKILDETIPKLEQFLDLKKVL